MPAEAVFRVGRAYGMAADRGVYQAVAVQDGRITAIGTARDELDSFIGPGTAVIDDPELVLYPAFADTHNHQLLAPRSPTSTRCPRPARSRPTAASGSGA